MPMYCPYSAQIPLPRLQTHQHHSPSISPQLLCFLVFYCQVSFTCVVEHTIHLCPVRQNVGIVKKDPAPLWGLWDSKDWFILRGKPTLLNTIEKVQANTMIGCGKGQESVMFTIKVVSN